ncbi:MAG: murein L,D-transpeptidase catalytic domain family protein [Alphaproteobacteria bacterium]|nr:murein L,D-transpeptidase catalytic domain family protein [Alphaproteobacteria bacterium]
MDPQNVIADDIQSEALAAYRRHAASRAFKGTEIVIVDYRKPSNAPRLFVLDLATGGVEAYYVAHGRGSDPAHTKSALRFSDAPTTGMSSVGAFRGLELYQSPEHGPAMRLAGLDSTNVNAYDRLIVFHTASYFNPAAGRFGRSCGCFVVTKEAMARIYGVLSDGGFLYAGPARLHDRTATTAQDCNPACGGGCRPAPLIAAAKRPDAPVLAKAAPAPTPVPAAPPVQLAVATPPTPAPVAVAAVQDVPIPLAKPDLKAAPVPAMVMAEVPVPLAKPDLALPMVASAEAPSAPVPLAKPDLRPSVNDTSLAAVPDLLVPNPEPGDVPVPISKPVGLQRMAELVP